MASIDPIGDGKFKVRWRIDGKQKSKSLPDLPSAKRFKASLEGDLANATYIDPKLGGESVRSYGERWFASLTLKESTLERRSSILTSHVFPEFGSLPLNAVTTYQINEWVQRSIKTKNPGSVNQHCNVMAGLFSAALADGLIRTNPCVGMRRPRIQYKEQRFLTLEESWMLIENSQQMLEAMVALAIFGGMRFGELSALRRKDINVLKSQVRVRQSVIYARNKWHFEIPKTKNSIRTVTIPRSVMRIVEDHLEEFVPADKDSLLFEKNGTPYQRGAFRLMYWLPLTRSVGLEGLRFHDLRHTFVSLWIALGRNPKEVSKAAGHSSVAFTLDRYGHLYEDDEEGLADALDNMINTGHMRTHMGAQDTPREGQNPRSGHAKRCETVVEVPHRDTLWAGRSLEDTDPRTHRDTTP